MAKPLNPAPRIKQVLSTQKVERAIKDLYSYVATHFDFSGEQVALVGIQSRGVILANRLAHQLKKEKGEEILLGSLDITLYRDDVSTAEVNPIVGETHLDFDLDDKKIILIDDVLFTGRTIRAALDQLMDYGRPKSIHLIVLVDRGHRELPIAAEYSAIKLTTEANEFVNLHVEEIDQKDEIVVLESVTG